MRTGNDMFHRILKESLPEHLDLMTEVWSPTPWMTDVFTKGREDKIWQWCHRTFGPESSPIHGHIGSWRSGSVTMLGLTWYGFESEKLLTLFLAQFPSTTE